MSVEVLTVNAMKYTKNLNNLTEEQEQKQWEEIERMENGKTLAELYGEEAALDILQKKPRYFQKKADKLIEIISREYYRTKNKVYLHILHNMGVDVDYSPED